MKAHERMSAIVTAVRGYEACTASLLNERLNVADRSAVALQAAQHSLAIRQHLKALDDGGFLSICTVELQDAEALVEWGGGMAYA